VPRAGRAEHAGADVDDVEAPAAGRAGGLDLAAAEVGRRLLDRPLVGALLALVAGPLAGAGGLVAHASSPFIWWVGVASRAAASAARAASSRLTPSGEVWICRCSSKIALSSISGR